MRKSSKKKDYENLYADQWPSERDVLFRPDRLKYVRKLVKPKGCVFCQSAQAKPSLESLSVWHSEHSMVVLNKYPYNSGHVLVLPKQHGGDMSALSSKVYTDWTVLLRVSSEIVRAVYKCDGLNIGLNHGAVAGAGIPDHLHFHLIPRWFGDVNFFPLIADTKVVIESLESTYEKLLKAYTSAKKKGRL